ncbi:hypothetical protein L596_011862 [Steinernema carpocapsae]|uniref:Uncharacterized protein n=1 Tax=Steinernema carpocapsae TaxID=34508 RepID=A0A4U5NVZ8_STECR|nr:hypothetical protein L596_011862 [Steinernema carpocapsae]
MADRNFQLVVEPKDKVICSLYLFYRRTNGRDPHGVEADEQERLAAGIQGEMHSERLVQNSPLHWNAGLRRIHRNNHHLHMSKQPRSGIGSTSLRHLPHPRARRVDSNRRLGRTLRASTGRNPPQGVFPGSEGQMILFV